MLPPAAKPNRLLVVGGGEGGWLSATIALAAETLVAGATVVADATSVVVAETAA